LELRATEGATKDSDQFWRGEGGKSGRKASIIRVENKPNAEETTTEERRGDA